MGLIRKVHSLVQHLVTVPHFSEKSRERAFAYLNFANIPFLHFSMNHIQSRDTSNSYYSTFLDTYIVSKKFLLFAVVLLNYILDCLHVERVEVSKLPFGVFS